MARRITRKKGRRKTRAHQKHYGGTRNKTIKNVVKSREVGLVKAEISAKKAEAARFSWMRRHGLA